MSSTKEQRASSPLASELAVDEREGRLQRRRERGGHVVCTSIGLLSYRTSFVNKYQVPCYCSFAKPDPHTKSKTLVSQDRYGIVFMH